MKVMHIPYCFYPDSVGGTEVYVAMLSRRLDGLGVTNVIVAPGERDDAYLYDGFSVRRFAVPETIKDIEELYGCGNPQSAESFSRILEEEKPDIVHLHSFTRAVSVLFIEAVKKRDIKLIFTYHTPTVSCQCGLLMRWRNQICDGKLRLNLCVACTLNRFGVPRLLAEILCRVPSVVAQSMKFMHLRGKLVTAVRMRSLIKERFFAIHKLFEASSYIIAVSKWVQDVLLINNVPSEKIMISRHGIFQEDTYNFNAIDAPTLQGPLKLVFLGRIDWTKGLDVFLKALTSLPELSVEFDIYGVVQRTSEQRYQKKLMRIIGSDKRIHLLAPLPHKDIIKILPRYHYIVIPSLWLETGPLVALEALLARVPVIGSDIGGIAEIIIHEQNGLLVKQGSHREWRKVLLRIVCDRTLQGKLRSGIIPPRKMIEVAQEMKDLYMRCCGENDPHRISLSEDASHKKTV